MKREWRHVILEYSYWYQYEYWYHPPHPHPMGPSADEAGEVGHGMGGCGDINIHIDINMIIDIHIIMIWISSIILTTIPYRCPIVPYWCPIDAKLQSQKLWKVTQYSPPNPQRERTLRSPHWGACWSAHIHPEGSQMTIQSPKRLYKTQPDYTRQKNNQELSDKLVNLQSGDTSNLTIW